MLPDILRYDPTKPRFYPNGRRLIEDIYSYRFAWLTYGKVPPQGLKPHAGLLVDFPYLGPPTPNRRTTARDNVATANGSSVSSG